jgi:hypothetical protein
MITLFDKIKEEESDLNLVLDEDSLDSVVRSIVIFAKK